MLDILVITSNKSKIKEIQTILKDYNINVRSREYEIAEYRFDTLEQVSQGKATLAFEHFKQPLLVDDTGIFFKAFEQFPGVVTRFVFEQLGFDGILDLLNGRDRGAFYKSCITYINETGKSKTFTGEFHGTIAQKPSEKVDLHFPYDSIFIPEGETIPRIELDYAKRIEGSHRRKALFKLRDFLTTENS